MAPNSTSNLHAMVSSGASVSYQHSSVYDDSIRKAAQSSEVEERKEFPSPSPLSPRRWHWAMGSAGLLSVILFFMYKQQENQSLWDWMFHNNPLPIVVVHKETIPTLLSIVDKDTGKYLYALDNPLYDSLVDASFTRTNNDNGEKVAIPPRLHLDRLQLEHPGESVTLSWTMGEYYNYDSLDESENNAQGNTTVVTPETLVVLRCGDYPISSSHYHHFEGNDDDNENNNNKMHIFEAATVAQIQRAQTTTTADDESTTVQNSFWHIPQFPMVRQEACQFLFYNEIRAESGDKNNKNVAYQLLAESPLLDLRASVTKPTGVHWSTAPAKNDDDNAKPKMQLVVQFVTGGTGTPILVVVNDDNSPAATEGTSTTYAADDLCSAPANQTGPGKFQSPGQLHTIHYNLPYQNSNNGNNAHIKNGVLEYKVGLRHGQGTTWSDVYQLVLPVAPGSNESFSYLVYGDQGCPSGGWGMGGQMVSALAATQISNRTQNVRAVHHFGDLSYAQGAAHQWDAWMAMIQPWSTQIPLYVAVGNHEYDHALSGGGGPAKDPSHAASEFGYTPVWGNYRDDSGGECGVPVSKRFAMPQTPNAQKVAPNGVFWYSFDFGMVHTIVLSSEHDLSPSNSPQYQWLAADLASVNRTRTPWLVVESHRPLYEGEADWEQNAVTIGIRYHIEDLLVAHRVDLVLSGHYHAYHRTCDGLYQSACDNGGPLHVTIGSAGAALDDTELYANNWTARYIRQEYGYGKLTVANASAMLLEFIPADEAGLLAGTVHDQFWIRRERERER